MGSMNTELLFLKYTFIKDAFAPSCHTAIYCYTSPPPLGGAVAKDNITLLTMATALL